MTLQEDRWRRFLEHVVAGVAEAARRIAAQPLKDRLEARQNWFGRPLARLDAQVPDETSVTQALCEVLEDISFTQKVEGLGSADFDLRAMVFDPEHPRKHDARIGPASQPTDMRIAVALDMIDFRIEAKKVLNVGDIRRAYLGRNGLERFDDRIAPYTLEPFGAMLAYVIDDDAGLWEERVRSAIDADIPAERRGALWIADCEHPTTIHEREVDLPLTGAFGSYRTEVIHLVMEIDARPSQRPAA